MTSFLQVLQLRVKQIKHEVDVVKVKGEGVQVRDFHEVQGKRAGEKAMILAVVEVPVVFLLFLVFVFFSWNFVCFCSFCCSC